MCRITLNRKKAEFKIAFYSKLKDWDEKIGEPKRGTVQSAERKLLMTDIESAIENYVLDANRQGKTITAIQLKDLLTGKAEQKHTLLSMSLWVIGRYEKLDKAPEQLSKLKQTLKYLEQYLTWDKKIGIPLENVTQQMVKDFETYLSTQVKYGPSSKFLDKNTVGKHMSRFKTIWRHALNSELVSKNIFNDYRIPKVIKRRKSLNLEEFNNIKRLDLRNQPEKERVRDAFLFCCYMGLRFSDSQEKIRTSNLDYNDNFGYYVLNRTIDGYFYSNIEFEQNKNLMVIQVPIMKEANVIIEKYKSENFRQIEGRILPPFTNQHANRILKLIALDAKISPNKKLTFHLSRHTCAQLQLEAGIQEKVTGSWLGQVSNSITSQYQNTYDKILNQAAEQFEEYLNS